MKKLPLLILILVAAGIAWLLSYSASLTTYDTIVQARKKPGQFVHIIGYLEKQKPVLYDPIQNPNYLVFYVRDSTAEVKVTYRNAKPADLEQSNQIVLKGSMTQGYFDCKEILLKCPSKYKGDRENLSHNVG